VSDLSDPLSSKYDQLYQGGGERIQALELNGWPRHRNEAVLQLARREGRLLEIGCGEGALLAALAPGFEEAVGTELSATRARRAKRNLACLGNCRVVGDPLERLPEVIGGTFDCIVWTDVIEHVVDVIEAMRVMARLSREGTQLITVTPNAAYLPQRLRVMLGRSLNTSLPRHRNEGFAQPLTETLLLDGGHLHYFTFRQVEMLYEMAGYGPTRRLGYGRRLSRLRDLWPTLLSGAVCVSGIYEG
jgi:2-polyprenyl-3-methyl-5-hydroxy-6-metoxy-1,4-benzoquinol methylase